MSRYSITTPYLDTLIDADGRAWQFAYWGTGKVYIREVIEGINDVAIPLGGSRDQWPCLIDLSDWERTPDTVTGLWLNRRARGWIIARNEDLANGNITD